MRRYRQSLGRFLCALFAMGIITLGAPARSQLGNSQPGSVVSKPAVPEQALPRLPVRIQVTPRGLTAQPSYGLSQEVVPIYGAVDENGAPDLGLLDSDPSRLKIPRPTSPVAQLSF